MLIFDFNLSLNLDSNNLPVHLLSVMSLQCSFELEISRQRQDDRAASAGIEGWECEGFKLRLSIVVGLSLRVISLGFGFAIYKPRP
ncbi:hypothetical protein Ptr86124_012431 [Pyrenophora tritici-repentis]|uniref:Uncharacterized protein n=1 Tax=Pyrenophora tritici-repentis TaxID=45151 RepID=A0A922N2T7_9PLEO|nr:hypothetical protein Ptr86124_012431 [Pyrenophora tritici-repentis]